MSSVLHGGRLDEAKARFGGADKKWLDLSTGINPNSWPIPEIEAEAWQRLPDVAAENACREAARAAFEANESSHISLAPGSQMHLQILPTLFKPQSVAIVGFTYQEHGVCWQRTGHEVYVTDGLESAEATARIVVVVNPNNPDGRVFDREELISLSRRLAAKGGLLVVDEAFCDAVPNVSVANETGRDGLLVLRSFGKFFGLAGVRLGFALCAEMLGKRLDAALGPWAVSGPALQIGVACLNDAKWRRKTVKKLQASRDDLEALLTEQKLTVVGGTSLFVVASHPKAAALEEHLGQAQILVRPFVGKPEWLRFGLPARKSEFNKLEKALKAFNSTEQ